MGRRVVFHQEEDAMRKRTTRAVWVAAAVVAALRPSYLARIVPAPEFARLAAQVEADLMAVLEELAGE